MENVKNVNFESQVSLKREIIGGLSTFFTMAYILVVNPAILSVAGVPKDGALFATAIASAIATFLVGIWAKLPFALAPGMGLNAYFAFVVCKGLGISWQTALAAVFLEGIIFLSLSLLGFRQKIFQAIPKSLAIGISAGIGLFISLIGLKEAGIIISDKNTLVSLGDISNIKAVIAVASFIFIAVLSYLKVTGAVLIGIIFATFLAWILGDFHMPTTFFSFPTPTAAFKIDWTSLLSLSILPIIVTFLLVDMFDTVGTLAGLSSLLGIKKDDKRLAKVLTVDAAGTTVGALLGTSTVTTYIESSAGIVSGARTGIASIVVAVLFLVSLFFYPILSSIPLYVTSGALIFVGFLMFQTVKNIDFSKIEEGLPAFVTLMGIPLTFSIANGIGFGFITYTILKLVLGKFRDLNPLIIIISIIFLLHFLKII